MEIEEKNKYIKTYLKNYFYKWLIKDIKIILKIMREEELSFTLPIILLVSAGIDFSGGLICGFKSDNVGLRSKKFIKEWMGRIHYLYKNEDINEVIYNCVRCGSVHQAMYKKGVEIISDNSTNNHLCLSNSGNILINTFRFANDFIESLRLFRKEYISNNVENVYQNLHKMVTSTNDFSSLRERLKTSNYICETVYSASSHSPSISVEQSSSIIDNEPFVIFKEEEKENNDE